MSIRVQGGVQNAETEDGTVGERAGEIGEKEAKTPEILRRSIEDPSKCHRSSFVISRLHHRSRTLAVGWALDEGAGAGRRRLGELTEQERLAEVIVQEAVSHLPHVGREVVLAVRVLHHDVLRHTVKAIDG